MIEKTKNKLIPDLKNFKALLVKCDLCNDCLPVCPTYNKMNDKRYSPINPILLGIEAFKKGFKFDDSHLDHLGVCALCNRCTVACPPEIDIVSLNLALKKEGLKHGLKPPGAYELLCANLDAYDNLYGIENDKRMDVNDERLIFDDEGEYLLYFGCMNAFYPELAKVYVDNIRKRSPEAVGLVHAGSTTPEEALSLYRLMKIARLKVRTLGEKEVCCGWPALSCGNEKLFKKLLKKLAKELKKMNTPNIVTTCGMCYYILKEYIPLIDKSADYNFIHASQLLRDLLKQGKLKPKLNPESTTYHEGCYLGRYAKEFEAPREVIKWIAKEHFQELADQKEKARCCGGSINFIYPDFALWIGQDLIKEAKEKEIRSIINTCPLCEMNIRYSVKTTREDLKVFGICSYVYENIEK